jgi:hypothetical protein
MAHPGVVLGVVAGSGVVVDPPGSVVADVTPVGMVNTGGVDVASSGASSWSKPAVRATTPSTPVAARSSSRRRRGGR